MLIVVWHHKETGDHWIAAETNDEAEVEYKKAIEAGAYTASICTVVKSTDYPVKPRDPATMTSAVD